MESVDDAMGAIIKPAEQTGRQARGACHLVFEEGSPISVDGGHIYG